MKVIDLLNKIANGEEVPKKIKYEEKEWVYAKNVQDYIYEKDIEIKYLIQEILNGYIATKKLLFYEVEIIEEVEDKLMPKHLTNDFIQGLDKYMTKQDIKHIAHKVNEVINYLQHISKED